MARLTRGVDRGLRALVLVVVAAGALGSCAGFRGEIPVTAQAPERAYISPGVPDGVKDRLIVGAAVAEAYKNMRIGGYRFTVTSSSGAAVRTIQESVVPQERTRRFILRPPAGMKVPANLIWEGRNDNGDLVPEGEYTYGVEAWDVYGNTGQSPRFVVVVDNTPPTVSLSAPYDTFSPNGDGTQDTLQIVQAGCTEEDEWRGEMRTARGETLRGFSWAGKAQDFAWDGLDESGVPVPDGTYGYVVSSTDRAGNRGSFTLEGLHLDTRPSAVALAVSPASFSPNGDGVLDDTSFRIRAENASSVERWGLVVKDVKGGMRRSLAGSGAPSESSRFDGRDDAGALLPDGSYTAEVDLWYRNGDTARATSGRFTIDTTAPQARTRAETLVFSPDGDGSLDSVRIDQESSDEAAWEGTISNAAGTVLLVRSWQGRAEPLEWDGRDGEGQIVPDGVYTYSLRSTDEAGNGGGATVLSLTVDARPTPVTLTAEFAAFSPNHDGRRDALRLLPALMVSEGVASWSIDIRDAQGTVRRAMSGTGSVPPSVLFDGTNDAGAVLPDGTYRGVLRVSYEKGDKASGTSPSFALDTTPPLARVSTEETLFSPDGDGRKDEITFLQSGSAEDLWLGTVTTETGRSVVGRSWRGRPTMWSWDGRDSDGRVVSDGAYTYVLRATDAAENSLTVEVAGVRVDTRTATATLLASAPGLSPNGDGVADIVSFRMAVVPQSGVKSWNLTLLDERREQVRVFGGTGTLGVPPELIWDGRDDKGRVTEGRYQAELSVEYERGRVARAALATPVLVDVSGPELTVRASPLPFSPDADGINDTLALALEARDPSPLASWALRIVDPEGNVFTELGAPGGVPASLSWDGRSRTGELVQSATDYTILATASDALGNAGKVSTPLPVDFLVMRDGDELRIIISSIYFKEFTADYRDVPADRARRNLDTLDKLAQKLARYPQYAIRIEGHAARIYWYDPVLLEQEERETLLPLSRQRAEVVKQALVERGIAADRMSTVGYGGSRPVVPHSDQENLWKNRRVEFVLVKM